jgi:hypothetical protein
VVVVILAWPWILNLPLVPFRGTGVPVIASALSLLLACALGYFSWRNPSGLAPRIVIAGLFVSTVVSIARAQSAFDLGRGAIQGVEALVLVALLVPIWRELRREHRNALHSRVDVATAPIDRRALNRVSKNKRRGYF